MARDLRPRIEWPVIESCFTRQLFDPARTMALIEKTGKPLHPLGLAAAHPDKLQEELNRLGSSFAFDYFMEMQPSASQEHAEANKLATALRSAWRTLGLEGEPTPEALLPTFGRGGLFGVANMRLGEAGDPAPDGAAVTMAALRSLWTLLQDAERFREIARKRANMHIASEGRSEQRSLNNLLEALSHLYWNIWIESPGITRRGGGEPPDGPYMRLALGFLEVMRERGVNAYQTAEAVAKRWERLEDFQKLRFVSTWPVKDG